MTRHLLGAPQRITVALLAIDAAQGVAHCMHRQTFSCVSRIWWCSLRPSALPNAPVSMLQRCCRPSCTRPSALNTRNVFDNMIRLPASSPFTTAPHPEKKATNIKWHESIVSREQKELLLGQRGCVLWFTGLSGSGKSTVACTLEHALVSRGRTTAQLDGDNVRHGLNSNLGFSPEDREENIRRVGEVAKLFAENGILTLASFISPYRKDRERVRALLRDGDFIEIYMKIPLEVRGMYASDTYYIQPLLLPLLCAITIHNVATPRFARRETPRACTKRHAPGRSSASLASTIRMRSQSTLN